MKKGQNLRVFVGDKVIACSTSCSFHIALQLEEATTKDDEGLFLRQEITGKSWDVSCDALYDPEATDLTAITPAELVKKMITAGQEKVTLKWDATEGDKNRTAKNVGFTGQAYINDASVNAAVKQNTSGTFQFTGDGPLSEISA